MAQPWTPKDILNVPPDEDQGSEAIYGFDYQTHCIARLCLWMVCSREITETICEYHEDLIQLGVDQSVRCCQVKKRESVEAWTIPLLKDAILKLFPKQKFRNVSELVIYGHGRPSRHGDYPLAGLIALLDRPKDERDSVWADGLGHYEQYLFGMLSPKLDADTVGKGLRLLQIRLTMPHPDAIESQNTFLTVETISRVWDVEVSVQVADKAYNALYRRAWEASKQPKQPRSVKRITVQEARQILREILCREGLLARDRSMLLETREKLERGDLEEHLDYALEKRMHARQVKYELGLKSTEWQDFKDDIAVAWEDFQSQNAGLLGKGLWRELRRLLRKLGEQWAKERKNAALGPGFSEALFFDMVSVCEANFGA
jgi:hypothetical protein